MYSDWDIDEKVFSVMATLTCILGGLPKDDRVASFRFLKSTPLRYRNSKKTLYGRYCTLIGPCHRAIKQPCELSPQKRRVLGCNDIHSSYLHFFWEQAIFVIVKANSFFNNALLNTLAFLLCFSIFTILITHFISIQFCPETNNFFNDLPTTFIFKWPRSFSVQSEYARGRAFLKVWCITFSETSAEISTTKSDLISYINPSVSVIKTLQFLSYFFFI